MIMHIDSGSGRMMSVLTAAPCMAMQIIHVDTYCYIYVTYVGTSYIYTTCVPDNRCYGITLSIIRKTTHYLVIRYHGYRSNLK